MSEHCLTLKSTQAAKSWTSQAGTPDMSRYVQALQCPLGVMDQLAGWSGHVENKVVREMVRTKESRRE
jgi:hypothetical protein